MTPIRIDAVRMHLVRYMEAKGPDAGVALLARFGAKNVGQIPVTKYAEFVSAVA